MSKAKKPVAKPEAENYPRKAVQVLLQQGDSEEEVARKKTAVMITPEMAALRVIRGAEQKAGNWEGMDVPALMDQLRDQAEAVNRGDLAQAEAMLMNQATALQSLFARLAERGMGSDMVPAFEANMRMALRAQSQCRATLETLSTIKNPPIVYAKQANFAAGHQQVNNGIPAPAQAREIESEQSQLSGVTNELLSDARASGIEGRANPALETVGEVNRAKIGRGKATISHARL